MNLGPHQRHMFHLGSARHFLLGSLLVDCTQHISPGGQCLAPRPPLARGRGSASICGQKHMWALCHARQDPMIRGAL